MVDEIERIVISSLLHDIGKVVQRSKSDERAREKKHQEWGAEWIEKIFTVLSEEERIYLTSASKYHHWLKEGDPKAGELSINKEPQSKIWFNWLIYEADNLSAGERETKREKWEKNQPLTSIFWKIRINDDSRNDYHYKNTPWVYPLEELGEKIVYPHPFEKNKNLLSSSSYELILNKLEKDIKNLLDSRKLSSDFLLPILERYLSFVPSETGVSSDYYQNPDVSLYDHLKLASAIALCMYLFLEEKYGKRWKEEPRKYLLENDEEMFLLIGGDISGIQDFIYTITSKNALKSLRGRSFYLTLLTEHVVLKLIQNLNLKNVCVIYKGGGTFFILAPNTETVKEKVIEYDKDLNRYLFNKFNGKLFFAIDFISFFKNAFYIDYQGKRIFDYWEELEEKINLKKKRKFSEIFTKSDFEPQNFYTDECDVCKKSISEEEKKETEDLILCEECYSFIKSGETLKNSKYLVLQKEENRLKEDNVIKIENWFWSLCKDLPEIDKIEIFTINKFEPGYIPLWIANYSAEGGNFEEIVKKGEGAEYLGTLRMDVDNLGYLIFKGLPENQRTFSRIATFSRLIQIFFSRGIQQISCGNLCELKDERNEEIYPLKLNNSKQGISDLKREIVVVYSGGDDLLVSGAWNDCLEFAFDVRKAFKYYTCLNPDIDISGGFVITHYSAPVYHISEIAGKAEDESKSIEEKFGRKGKFFPFYSHQSSIKRPLKWEKWEELVNEVIFNFLKLGKWENGEFLPEFSKSFIYKLYRLSYQANKTGAFSLPLTFDAFNRAKRREWEKDEEKLKIWEKLRQTFLNLENLKIMISPLQWIDLYLRKKGGKI